MRGSSRRFRWLWWLPVTYLLATGYIALVYSGYQEDAGSPVTPETWPLGVASWLLAAFIAWTALRKQRPGRLHVALIGFALAALFFWAWGPFY
jgi:hypothetical protein